MATIISIINQKGGVGKTTTAYELAYLYASDGGRKKKAGKNGSPCRTLAIDLDSQRDLSRYSGADLDQPTIGSVLRAEIHPADAIQHTKWFDIIPAGRDLIESAQDFVEEDLEMLQAVIDVISDDYDIIIIDNAPARSPLLYMAYMASDYIIAVTECDDGSIEGVSELAADIMRFKANNKTHSDILGILLTKYEKTNMHTFSLQQLERTAKEAGTRVFKNKIRKAIVVSETKTARMPIGEYSRYNNSARDYRALFTEINKLIEQKEP